MGNVADTYFITVNISKPISLVTKHIFGVYITSYFANFGSCEIYIHSQIGRGGPNREACRYWKYYP